MKENLPDFELEARVNSLFEEYGSFPRASIIRLCLEDLGLQVGDIEHANDLERARSAQEPVQHYFAASLVSVRIMPTKNVERFYKT